jgi:hypothetical protein
MLYGGGAPDDTGTPDRHNIILEFNNITQWLCYDDFLALEWNVRSIDTRAYFDGSESLTESDVIRLLTKAGLQCNVLK